MFDPTVMRRLRAAITNKATPASPPPAPTGVPASVDCRFRDPRPIDSVVCSSCAGRVELKVFSCEIHGRCSVAKVPNTDVTHCQTCADRRTNWPKQYDHRNLWPDVPGMRFNTSILEWFGGYVCCFRNGWKGSDLYCGFLSADFEPVGSATRLDIRHDATNYGREDPRLFLHRGKLHVSFTGVVGGKILRHTNVLYARLGPNFRVEEVIHPHVDDRNPWEKNHAYFSHGNELHCVYSIRPHRVLRVIDGKSEWRYEEPFPLKWDGGEWRGGASPVRIGDEYWHFCHDRTTIKNVLTYRTLLYTFAAQPPFRPLRYLPEPILTADLRNKPADQYCACVFCCGAVLTGRTWNLSHGVHDRWTEIHRFDHPPLNAKLIPVG